LVVLQNLTDLEKARSPHREICPASTDDAYQPISIKAEKLSDAEDDEDPAPMTFVGIKAEPEVSCVSVSILGGFHKYEGDDKSGFIKASYGIEKMYLLNIFPLSSTYVQVDTHSCECTHSLSLLPPPVQPFPPTPLTSLCTLFSNLFLFIGGFFMLFSFCRWFCMKINLYMVRSGHVPVMSLINLSVKRVT
jgi:hypothetical protein